MDSTSSAKTVLFWMFIVLLCVVLFRMVSTSHQPAGQEVARYSDFMKQVERNNVRDVTIYVASNSYDIEGNWRDSSKQFSVTVVRESAEEIIKELRDHDVSIDVKEITRADWVNFLLTAAPIFLLIGFWIIMMRQMKIGKKQ